MREHQRQRVSLPGYGGFHSVGNGIDAGGGGDPRRLREGERRIKNGGARNGLGIEASHFLMRSLVHDEGRRLTFTSSAGSSRDGQEWKHRLTGFANPPVILHATAVAQKKVAPFGG